MRICDWSADVCSSDLRERCAARSGSECGDRLAEADVIAKEQGLLPHREHRGLLLVEIGLVRLAEDVRDVDRRPVERQDLHALLIAVLDARRSLGKYLALCVDRKSTRLNSSH